MKGLLRPLLVGGLSIAIGGIGLLGGGVAFAAGSATPASVAVTVSPTVVVEGDTVTLTVQLDSAATEQLGVTVTWGDASTPDTGVITPGQLRTALPFMHLYVDNAPTGTPQGFMAITVKVENGTATTSLAASASVLVKNAPPTFTSLTVSPSTVSVGQGFTLSGVFADVGTADRHSVLVDWGNGDVTGFARLPAGTHTFDYANAYTYGFAGTYTITARVTDDDFAWVEATVQLTVLPANVAPSNLLLAMSAVAEGGASTLTGSFTDPDAADTHNVTVDWGDGSSVDVLPTLPALVYSFKPTHTYANTGTYTVTVVLKDSAGHSITGTTSVSVSNVAPSVTLGAIGSPVAGDNVDLTGTISDPGTKDTFTVSVDWGDATPKSTPVLGADGHSFSASHTYLVEGSYPVLVTVTDRDGASGTAAATIVVRHRNVAPTNLTLSAPAVALGATTTLTGAFSDPDPLDTHVAVVTWGDATPSVTLSLAAGATSFTATHAYAAAGTYSVSATVTDAAGAATSATTSAVVTAPATTTALLGELTGLVKSFNLDRYTERWLLRRVDDLRSSLANGSNDFCDAVREFDSLPLIRRALTTDQLAALNDLTARLRASANCSPTGDELGQHTLPVLSSPQTLTTPTAPKPALKNDEEKNDQNNNDHRNDQVKNSGAQGDSVHAKSVKGVHHSQANN